MWVVVNIRVLFWVLIIIRHLLFRVPKRDLNFDNYPCAFGSFNPLGLVGLGVEGLHMVYLEDHGT